MDPPASPADLGALHARHKMDLLARDPQEAERLGRLVAAAGGPTFPDQRARYLAGLAEVRRRVPSRGGNRNALLHLLGHVRSRAQARRLAGSIAAYARGELALNVVKRDLHRVLQAEGDRWAATQTFLEAGGCGSR